MKDETKEDGRLYFSFKEFIDEIDAISSIAGQFIDGESQGVLPRLKTSLENIRGAQAGRLFPWGIPETKGQALRTVHRQGEYEPDHRRGRENVFAEISSTWGIEPLDLHGPKQVAGRKFMLVGNASTRVEIYRFSKQGQHQRVAMWRMELGADDSPGCFFHVQVLGQDHRRPRRPPFPKSIPVPRLPTFLATPMATLEFVLGELFQTAWKQEVARENQKLKQWREIQQRRLTRLNVWENELLSDKDNKGSPWITLKNKKPRRNLFLSE
jgi:hypothetical protein